jgi:hypothetical protein
VFHREGRTIRTFREAWINNILHESDLASAFGALSLEREKAKVQLGAGGGGRTRTRFEPNGILSPHPSGVIGRHEWANDQRRFILRSPSHTITEHR